MAGEELEKPAKMPSLYLKLKIVYFCITQHFFKHCGNDGFSCPAGAMWCAVVSCESGESREALAEQTSRLATWSCHKEKKTKQEKD